ncbi:MAG: DUF551 domain-containing protein [Leclercia sp.]
MAEFTKEWLEQSISGIKAIRDEIPFGLDADEENTLSALKIALAVLTAEPVAWTDAEELRDANEGACGYLFAIDGKANKFSDPRRMIMLYAAPLLPQATVRIDFVPKNLDRALGVMGMALPESREEFNLQQERWTQRLIDRVIRCAGELGPQPAVVIPLGVTWEDVPEEITEDDTGLASAWAHGFNQCRAAMLQGNHRDLSQPVDPQVAAYGTIMQQAVPANSLTNAELEGMAHGDNPQSNAYRELLAFRLSATGWIPCSERMPEREKDVQLYMPDSEEQMAGHLERNEEDGWFRYASWRTGTGVYCKPTHWMPLPAAPQQEAN